MMVWFDINAISRGLEGGGFKEHHLHQFSKKKFRGVAVPILQEEQNIFYHSLYAKTSDSIIPSTSVLL